MTELRSPADMSSLIRVLPNDDAHVIVFYYILIIFLHLSVYIFLFFRSTCTELFSGTPGVNPWVCRPARFVQRSEAVLVQVSALLSRLCDQVL